jgi:hypothetical protein
MHPFKICNRIKLVYFLKFIVHKINSKMVKSKMLVLTRREILQPAARALVGKRERKS